MSLLKVDNLNSIVLYQNETGSKIIEVLYDSEDFGSSCLKCCSNI